MTLPALAKETGTLIDYARPRFADERWPMSSVLRPAREILTKLDSKPKPRTRFATVDRRD
jgi:hypothetical protein